MVWSINDGKQFIGEIATGSILVGDFLQINIIIDPIFDIVANRFIVDSEEGLVGRLTFP